MDSGEKVRGRCRSDFLRHSCPTSPLCLCKCSPRFFPYVWVVFSPALSGGPLCVILAENERSEWTMETGRVGNLAWLLPILYLCSKQGWDSSLQSLC